MLLSILKIEIQPKFLDATDALAVAVCHSYQQGAVAAKKKTTAKKKSAAWSKFVADNPHRIAR
jgi:crossover junction endodeoxyribonuclease RuvC